MGPYGAVPEEDVHARQSGLVGKGAVLGQHQVGHGAHVARSIIPRGHHRVQDGGSDWVVPTRTPHLPAPIDRHVR